RAVLGRLAGQVDLDQQLDSPAGRMCCLVEPFDKLRAVDRVDHIEAGAGLSGLVRLEVTNEMPLDLEIGSLINLEEGLLYFVLAEVDLPGKRRRANVLYAKHFRNGDEPDRSGITSGAKGGLRDAIADLSKPQGQDGTVEHTQLWREHLRPKGRGPKP